MSEIYRHRARWAIKQLGSQVDATSWPDSPCTNKRLSEYASPAHPAEIHLSTFLHLVELNERPELLKQLADMAAQSGVETNGIVSELHRCTSGLGRTADAIERAYADGKVEAHEDRDMRNEVDELLYRVTALHRAIHHRE